MDEAQGWTKWERHVKAAREEGKPLSRYAREHGIGSWNLYKAQRRMRKGTAMVGVAESGPARNPAPLVSRRCALHPWRPCRCGRNFRTAYASNWQSTIPWPT
jgi:hypothetical protein